MIRGYGILVLLIRGKSGKTNTGGGSRTHLVNLRSWTVDLLRYLLRERTRWSQRVHQRLKRYNKTQRDSQGKGAKCSDDSRRQVGSQPRGRKPDDQDGALYRS